MRVYHKNYKKSKPTDAWLKAKQACLKRNKYTCQRCEKKGPQGKGLTAHHIIPRAEDGSDELSNLITLCDPCHDYVEIQNFRTWASIIGSYETESNIDANQSTRLKDEGYSFKRPAWHKYVYGGQRRK
jgi:hypothetical protein